MRTDDVAGIGLVLVVVGAFLVARIATRGTQSTKMTVLAIGGVLALVLVGLLFLVWIHLFTTLEGPRPVLHSARSEHPAVSQVYMVNTPAPPVSPFPKVDAALAVGPSPTPAPPSNPKPSRKAEDMVRAVATQLGQVEKKAEPKEKAIAPPSDQAKPKKPISPADSQSKPAPPQAPSARPDWIDAPPGRVGDGLGVYQMCLTVGPYSTTMECEKELPAQLARALDDYADLYLGSQVHGQIPFDLQATVGPNRTPLAEFIVRDVFNEEIQTSLGPMEQMHVRIELNSTLNDWLKSQWREVQVHRRIWYAGAGLTAVLGMLSVVFFFLKIDSATDKRHWARLGILAGLLMLALVAVLWVAFRLGSASFL